MPWELVGWSFGVLRLCSLQLLVATSCIEGSLENRIKADE